MNLSSLDIFTGELPCSCHAVEKILLVFIKVNKIGGYGDVLEQSQWALEHLGRTARKMGSLWLILVQTHSMPVVSTEAAGPSHGPELHKILQPY